MSGRARWPLSGAVAVVLLLGLFAVLQAQRTNGPGLSGGMATQVPIASLQPPESAEGQARQGATPTLPASTGTAVTMTWEILLGEEWVDNEIVEVVAASAGRFIATSTSMSLGDAWPHRAVYVDGDGFLEVFFDSESVAGMQFGRRLDAELPTFLAERLDRHHARSASDRSVARLLNRRVLMLDCDEVEAAVSTGIARIVERENVEYAIPATVVEVQAEGWDSGYNLHRTWVDNLHGIKFRVEMLRDDGEIGRIGMMVGFEFDVNLEDVDFSPPPLRGVKADYFESRPFDEQMAGAEDKMGVRGLLHPGSAPIYENLRLRRSAYVTGTQETDPGWLVAQELRDDAGANVLVLQGDDRRSLPWLGGRDAPIYRYWPPAWNGMSADEVMWGELRQPQDFHLEDGTAVRAHECTPQSDLTWEHEGSRIQVGLQAMDCDELITWVDGTHNRVVLAMTGYERPVAMEVAGAFRRAARGGSP